MNRPLLAASLAVAASLGASEPVDFQRDVFPIFEANCFGCHGPDEQEGQLRLDARSSVIRGGVSGKTVTPAKPADSLLYQRLVTNDADMRMPLDEEPLQPEQIELIRRWIEQGATWPDSVGAEVESEQTHWAYLKPKRAALPPVADPGWCKTPVDYFVLTRLEQEGLSPSEAEDRERLLRRVYLDLIGIPPSVEELDQFLADKSPDALETVVDRLLAMPQYGERWARPWLDAARYADSNGYQADQYRNIWPYRDWVIRAMNADMPFDQFTIEQLAGDLLPGATLDQKIATGFHRLTTCNVEAGVDPEENRTNQIIDRVNTTGTVWLGSTIECAQCHSHKYDPFSQKEYYELFAYFNNTPLEVEGNGVTYDFVGPKMDLPMSESQQVRRAEQKRQYDQAKARVDELTASKKKESKKVDPQIKKAKSELARLKKQLDATKPFTTLVMVEQQEPRMTHLFKRGEFLSKSEPVAAGTPRVLHAPESDLPPNRLGFARWLTDKENPLTARVVVNRWWAEFFGRGIVETIEDFGTQGEPPTHPELLDWLACELMDSGWSMKHVHKQIVMSAMYQQSSAVSRKLLKRDPVNKLYARGPRFRVPAETLRDNGLAAAGLLSKDMAGEPIYPPQPTGIWRHVGRNAPKYNTSTGNDRFRRGIYVVWRRSAPYPSFSNFDAPDRASCVVQRPRTNTPLQALTLMNDPAYVEMSLALAGRMASDHSEMTIDEKIAYGFRLCTSRQPSDDELEQLEELYRGELARLEQDPKAAEALVDSAWRGQAKTTELAAWFFVANVLLNLDESITKS